MSAENLEAVRRWQAAAASASLDEALAAVPELWDPDVDYYPVRKFPESRPCHGIEQLTEFATQWSNPFSLSEWTVRELIAVGDDRVLA